VRLKTKLKPDNYMRTLAIGDIHGNYKALMQCFERSKFDENKYRLIVLGDVYDSFPDSSKCVEQLMHSHSNNQSKYHSGMAGSFPS